MTIRANGHPCPISDDNLAPNAVPATPLAGRATS